MATQRPTATYDDVNLVLSLYETRRESRLRDARAWFVANFRASDLDEFYKLCPTGSPENASFRMVVSYWDMVASFIASGVLNQELFFESGRELLLVYIRIKEMLPAAREVNKDPYAYKNLETVALAMQEWMNKRAPGSYEAFEARIMASVR
jgi:hypothetical protein